MHPILLRLPLPGWKLPWFGELPPSLPIHSYGVMLGLSLVVGWYLTLGLAEKDGLPKETLANCYVFTALVAVIMSRVLYFVTNTSEFKTPWEIFALWRGGLVAYGGFLGGFLGSFIYLRRAKIRLMPWGDVAAPSLAAGLMFTRIGCYLFGCDFGKPLSGAAPEWLKKLGTFPHWPEGTLAHGAGSPAWVQHVQHRALGPDTAASFPVHPTQIYESLVGAFLLLLCLFVRRHQKFRGQVFLVFTFGYGVLRFLLEMIRDDLERGEFGPHLAEQIMVPGGLLLFSMAYIWAIAPSVEDPIMRRMTQVVAVVPVLTAYLVLRPASFGDETLVQLSTSQWVAILTALPAAAAYAVFWNGAQIHPESAMSLGLEDFVSAEGSGETAERSRASESAAGKGEGGSGAGGTESEPVAPLPSSDAGHAETEVGKEPA